MLMYNGERDGSSCNHIGNMKVAQMLNWQYNKEFNKSNNRKIETDKGKMIGFMKQ